MQGQKCRDRDKSADTGTKVPTQGQKCRHRDKSAETRDPNPNPNPNPYAPIPNPNCLPLCTNS